MRPACRPKVLNAAAEVGEYGAAEILAVGELVEDGAEFGHRADPETWLVTRPAAARSTSSRMSCTVPTAE